MQNADIEARLREIFDLKLATQEQRTDDLKEAVHEKIAMQERSLEAEFQAKPSTMEENINKNIGFRIIWHLGGSNMALGMISTSGKHYSENFIHWMCFF